jgi:hypothetical protein
MSRLSKRSEANRSESFDNDVFFDIEAKRTRLIVKKIISKRSEHVYIKEFKNRSKANTFDSSKIYFEVKRTCLFLFELKNQSEANNFDSLKIYFEAKRTCLY